MAAEEEALRAREAELDAAAVAWLRAIGELLAIPYRYLYLNWYR
jgi:hypothetical protein